jgi:hypothetical protein
MQASINPPGVLLGNHRVVLGVTQMSGANIVVVCLYRYGSGRETMIALFATLGATILSIFLFRGLRVQGKDRP